MNILAAAAGAGNATNGILMIVLYCAVIFGFLYFTMIRPQKKEQTRVKSMLESLEVGDSVLTSSGFYGVIIDIADDTVIVEFGSNRNCRIPMQKTAITAIEKPDNGTSKAASEKK
ncbi:MAG: preprotein translocase subunit YajC [Lachnospiraceae bacterium]|nr:preprotein translocase subunit YajC [Lachnospiraceae bacterium]